MTACCLHNFIIQVGGVDEEPYEEEEPENDEELLAYGEAILEDEPLNAAAKRKRDAIKYILL
jgi:hypothetical protein